MTETPPETTSETPPEEPTPQPQQGEQPQQLAGEGEGADSLTYADHRTYSMALYGQPPWIIDAVWQSAGLDPNEEYPKGTISTEIDTFMSGQDARYTEEVQPTVNPLNTQGTS